MAAPPLTYKKGEPHYIHLRRGGPESFAAGEAL
jgi:hypothetical protein